MPDFDTAERELRSLLKQPAQAHPPIDVLMAYGQEVLPPQAEERVRLHLAQCASCVALREDMESLPKAELTPDRDARIRAGIPAASAGSGWKKAAIAAGILLALGAGAALYRQRSDEPKLAQQTPAAAPAIAQVEIPLSPLAPPQDSAISTTRGGPRGDEPSVSELMPAFTAYNARNYESASGQFAALAKSYPKSQLVNLYLGVSQLLVNRNTDALRSLEAARGIGSSRYADAADWYAAIAAQRTGSSEAKALLDGLCGKTGSAYSAESCRIAPTLP